MINRGILPTVLAIGFTMSVSLPAFASFHFMQIQQVIGGVNGDTSAQAIQLRIRFPGDNLVEFARIRAWDATGANPIMLIDFDTSVASGALGANVLIASESFINHTGAAITPDFILTNLIPDSYLAAGRITFEGDDGTIYFSLSFGGPAYTGSTTGMLFNDDDGDFGPPFDGPLPADGLQALEFMWGVLDLSESNQADYALTTEQAVFTNNAGHSTTVIGCGATIDLEAGVTLAEYARLQSCFSGFEGFVAPCCEPTDFNNDQSIDQTDYWIFLDTFIGP